MTRDKLANLLETKQATVTPVGLGYVGLPLCDALHEAGYRVLGFDTDPSKIDSLAAGKNYLAHLGDEMTRTLAESDRFDATSDATRLREADAILLCVPTPLGNHREPDLSYVEASTRICRDALRPGQLVVLESTTYPGTTRDVVLPILEESGLKLGTDFFVAYSPEREDPGRKDATTATIPKLVGGLDDASTELAMALYSRVVRHAHRVSSAEVAEAAKLLENIYRAVNIALVNEMKTVLLDMDIDVWEVVEAAATKPFGFQAFYPGPGLGGHCIPIDPFYLTWKAKEVGRPTRFIELAGEVNHAMPDYVIQRLMLALNDDERALRGAKVLVIGLAYKPNVDDIRESPSAEILEKLIELGADVAYHDPHIPVFPSMRKHQLDLKSVALGEDTLRSADAVLIATHHDVVDYEALGKHAKLIVDTRNVMERVPNAKARIVKA